jgi:arsenite oxidase small subunit
VENVSKPRRRFIEICAVGAGNVTGCAAGCLPLAVHAQPTSTTKAQERVQAGGTMPTIPKRSGVVLKSQQYNRVRLVDQDGKAILAASLKANHNYVFNYPFESTPCFLLNLATPMKDRIELLTEKGDAYTWNGGVGTKKNIVAYSAICAHKLAYPTSQVSFISYRNKPSPMSATGNVIGCCADKSVYDPANGARVLKGPAPQPLTTILLEHDAKTDQLFVVGTFGAEMFDAFFRKYEFKLSLEKGGSRARERVTGTTILRDLSAYSSQTAQC